MACLVYLRFTSTGRTGPLLNVWNFREEVSHFAFFRREKVSWPSHRKIGANHRDCLWCVLRSERGRRRTKMRRASCPRRNFSCFFRQDVHLLCAGLTKRGRAAVGLRSMVSFKFADMPDVPAAPFFVEFSFDGSVLARRPPTVHQEPAASAAYRIWHDPSECQSRQVICL